MLWGADPGCQVSASASCEKEEASISQNVMQKILIYQYIKLSSLSPPYLYIPLIVTCFYFLKGAMFSPPLVFAYGSHTT